MPGDLFTTGEVRSAERPRHASVLLISVVAHIVVVVAVLVLTIVAPGALPTPHAADLAWDPTSSVVHVVDIPLPPPPPRPTVAPVTPDAVPGDAPPLEQPDGISPEPARPFVPPPSGVVEGPPTGLVRAEAPPPVAPPPPQPPVGPVRVHAGISSPVKTHDVAPLYPVLARTTGATGVVIIEATIDTTGNVVAARVLRSIPMLDEAALDAVRQWKYEPARMNGDPVAVLITVTVNFVLGR